jgi:hypothetical protein
LGAVAKTKNQKPVAPCYQRRFFPRYCLQNPALACHMHMRHDADTVQIRLACLAKSQSQMSSEGPCPDPSCAGRSTIVLANSWCELKSIRNALGGLVYREVHGAFNWIIILQLVVNQAPLTAVLAFFPQPPIPTGQVEFKAPYSKHIHVHALLPSLCTCKLTTATRRHHMHLSLAYPTRPPPLPPTAFSAGALSSGAQSCRDFRYATPKSNGWQ